MEDAQLQNTPTPSPSNDSSVPMWLNFVGGIVALVCISWAIKTRTFNDFLTYGRYIIIASSIILLAGFIIYVIIIGVKGNLEWRLFLLLLFLVPLFLIPFAIIVYSEFACLKDFIFWIRSPTISKSSALILTALFIITVGVGLFYFRLKARATYGFTEATAGLAVSIQRVWDQPEQIKTFTFHFALLTASIYLFVRGLDNIHQGLTKEPIDPWGSRIYAFLKKKT